MVSTAEGYKQASKQASKIQTNKQTNKQTNRNKKSYRTVLREGVSLSMAFSCIIGPL